MKRILPSSAFLFLFTATLCGPAVLTASNKPETFLKQQNSKSGFIENKGQIIDQNNKPNPAVLYLLNTPGMNVQLRSSGWSYDLYSVSSRQSAVSSHASRVTRHDSIVNYQLSIVNYHRIDIDLLNANPNPTIETSAPSSDYLNYYTTGTPAEGVTSVRSYLSITYKNIYPNIDLEFLTDPESGVKYNFLVHPGGKLNEIRIKIGGPEIGLLPSGSLRFQTTIGTIEENIPESYIRIDKRMIPIKAVFKKLQEGIYGISINESLHENAELVIDPIPARLWGTYIGGPLYEGCWGRSCDADASGSTVIAGYTASLSGIATTGSYQTTYGGGTDDAFLARFAFDGSLQWCTYYGGSSYDGAYACCFDHDGNILMGGETYSTDGISTTGSFQEVYHGNGDAFLAKFTSTGLRLWGTYLGGGDDDSFFSVRPDFYNNIYCAGGTSSGTNIATPGTCQTIYGGNNDAMLIKFSPDGQRLWGTYYGGSGLENWFVASADDFGHIYLCGMTKSVNNISTPGSFMPNYTGTQKGFLASFTTSGTRNWGTYYGGNNADEVWGCAIGQSGVVYLTGKTTSTTNIATTGAYQLNLIGTTNCLIGKFNSDGTREWGTYYGGGVEAGVDCAVDDSGYVFVCGYTNEQSSVMFSPGAYQTTFGGGSYDAFLAKFTSGGQRVWGTYYGGESDENLYSMAVDPNDYVYIYGYTNSQHGIATIGSYQPEPNGTDCFLVSFADCYSPDTSDHITGPNTFCVPASGIIFSVDPMPFANSYFWNVPPGAIIVSGQHTTSITVDFGTGAVSGSITVRGINDCAMGERNILYFQAYPPPVPVITGNPYPLSGTSYTYSTETGKTNYQWTFSSGGSLVSGGGINDPTITIQWNVTGAQWVRVNYTDANGCSATTPTQMDIMVTTTVTVDFTSPDTVCVGAPINITNLTQGGTTFYWNFCSGNANVNPTGINIGNPGNLLSIPTYITLVKQGTDCFSFISCQGVGVIRYYHGTSFANNPVSWTNLGTFGLIGPNEEGIQMKYDNGNWYGFVNNDLTIIRLDFGNSLWNTPTAINIGPFPSFNFAHGLLITKEGTTWIGFVTNALGQNLVQLNFGTSLANIPVATNFGSLGGVLIQPGAICLVQENLLWFAMVMAGGNTIARLSFGNSLLNTPTGVNLGNPGGFNLAVGLTLLRDCSSTTGYWTNYLVNGQLGKLTFPTGITGSVTGTVLGNIGGLARPHSFSEIFRQNDTLFAYITDRDNGTLTRLTFPPCNNASVPSSTLFNPPPFSYNQPGTYNIHLIVDEGLPSMQSMCRPIVVMIPPVLSLGPDKSVCPGNTTLLDAGPGFTSYLWSTGATTRTINVPAGTYWVNGMRWGCTASDTILVSALVAPSVNLGPDTTICSGQTVTFDAGVCAGCSFQWSNLTLGLMNIGNGQTYTTGTAANYMVTVVGPNSCLGRDTVQLFVNPVNPVTLTISASDNNVCSGTLITFLAIAGNPGTAPVYQWFVNGNPVGINSNSYSYAPANGDVVTCTVTSNIACPVNNPASSLPVTMTVNPYLPVTVSISASSNPFCLGGPVTFTATPGGGGLTPSYQWKVNGANAGTDSPNFTYIPANGDLVNCILTSSEQCTSGNPASSITITMVENNSLPAGVSISASSNPFCPGTSVTFTAYPSNGGPTPSYQWKVNGVNAGTNSSTYSYNPVPNDSVRCIMTSNLPCVTGSPVSSAKIIMAGNLAPIVIFTSCFDTITTINAKPIKLKGGIPLGGIYSGPGVNSLTDIFTPSVAGIGTHTITYTYTNAALCSAFAHTHIINYPLSIVNCGSPITDVRDNKVYQTVQIGSQCWLATNLNFGTILASTQDQRDNCQPEKYCYNDNLINCTNHGGLYQWDELMLFDDTPATQGFCPPGWHIPSESDWNTLFSVYINNGFAGSPLKYSGYSGFNALLSGTRHINTGWDFQGFATFFWSSTQNGARNAWAHGMNDPDPSVSSYPSSRVNAFSVRCLKD